MRSPGAKVLHPLGGRPLLLLLVDTLLAVPRARVVCVVGHDAELVRNALPPEVQTVTQWPQRGTGDAVRVARSRITGSRTLVVLPGDAPLIRRETIRALLDQHGRARALATVLTAEPEDPAAYGRVVVGRDGQVQKIVEAVDADEETLRIRNINTGVYAFCPEALFSVIGQIGTRNRKGEFYLTDSIELLSKRGRVVALRTDDPQEVAGINDQADLARLEGTLQKRLRAGLLAGGVQIPHPQSVYLEPDVKVAPGARLLPGTHLLGKTVVGPQALIGPDTLISNSRIGARSRVWFSVVEDSIIDSDVRVGPYAHLRPKTHLARGARIGNFVETKAARIGPKARVLHLSYVGDATVGEDANIGAGTITCNFDGFKKHPTRIAARAFIGSNTALVAPVSVGARAVVGAGSVITQNVPADGLALTRAPQVMKRGWARKKRDLMKKRGVTGPRRRR